MIPLHRLNGKEIFLNSELIEYMETTPDTVITLTNGKKFVVQEHVSEIVNSIVNFKRCCASETSKERVGDV